MLYSDHPISKPSQDALGRAGFARELATAIDRLPVVEQGFVIGILGEWGAGKSSVIELVIRFLRHIEMARASESPILDEETPNPLSVDELEPMAEIYERIEPRILSMGALNKNLTYWERINREGEFVRWLGSQSDGKVANRYFQLALNVEARPKNIIVRFSPWLIAGKAELTQALLSELARSLSGKLGGEVTQAFGGLLKRLSEFAPVAGVGLDLIYPAGLSKLAGPIAKWSGDLATKMTSGPTLEEVRIRLKQALRHLDGQQIIVVVDDLDRLTPLEALEMVSLVKSLGDLPNVVYVLSYDQSKLSGLLRQALGVDGHSFLEKIVQYPKHLPIADQDDLKSLLEADLQALFDSLTPHESDRLEHTWLYVFQQYLRTPRDVRRYINALSVSLGALSDYVDRVDLALLVVLELYEPEVYSWLRQNLPSVVGD